MGFLNTVFLMSLSLLLHSQPANAESNPQLQAYFREKILQIEESAQKETATGGPEMEIQDLNIDITPTVNFGISDVLQLTISPEVDFVLTPVAAGAATQTTP